MPTDDERRKVAARLRSANGEQMTVQELIKGIQDAPENIAVHIDGQDGLYYDINVLRQVKSRKIVEVVLQ